MQQIPQQIYSFSDNAVANRQSAEVIQCYTLGLASQEKGIPATVYLIELDIALKSTLFLTFHKTYPLYQDFLMKI